MSFLGKEYTFYKQENYDTFLRFVGAPEDKIAVLTAFTPPLKLVQNGDSYTSYTKNQDGDVETTFKSGVEFDDVIGPEKIPIKATFVVEGNTVTQKIKSDKVTATLKREYNGDELVVTYSAEGFDGVAKKYYKA